MGVDKAIAKANALVPGTPVDSGPDPRWQAIIEIGEYVESDPAPVWGFICKWGADPQDDLRDAIATCLLEHILEHHFATYFPLLEGLVSQTPGFADTFLRCWPFGESEAPDNAKRWQALESQLRNSLNTSSFRMSST